MVIQRQALQSEHSRLLAFVLNDLPEQPHKLLLSLRGVQYEVLDPKEHVNKLLALPIQRDQVIARLQDAIALGG